MTNRHDARRFLQALLIVYTILFADRKGLNLAHSFSEHAHPILKVSSTRISKE